MSTSRVSSWSAKPVRTFCLVMSSLLEGDLEGRGGHSFIRGQRGNSRRFSRRVQNRQGLGCLQTGDLLHRREDMRICSAPAEIAGHSLSDLGTARMRIVVEQRLAG